MSSIKSMTRMAVMNGMDKFDLNLLRVFDAVWRHRRLRLASQELELSQPALSHSLKRLRERIGDPLFVKVPVGMQPTARAMQLAPVVQSILANVREHVLATPGFDPTSSHRSFTIAMTDLGEMILLPKLLGRLMSVAPAVDICTVAMPPRDLVAAFQKGQVDLAIGYFPDVDGLDILQQRLFSDGFACVVRVGHPEVHERLTQKQFQNLSHAVVKTEGRSREIVEQYLKQHGIRKRDLLRSPHFLSIPMVIASTDLVMTVPASVAELFRQIADLQVLQPPFPIPFIDVKQYWHRYQQSDPGNQWLRSIVVDLFRK
jgi:DNA-binding transcriptional LysR family regulator